MDESLFCITPFLSTTICISGFNRYFWSWSKNSRPVDQRRDSQPSAAAGFGTNTQPSATSRCVLLALCVCTPSVLRQPSLWMDHWLSFRSAALWGRQPAGHEGGSWRHRWDCGESSFFCVAGGADVSDWRIQEVKEQTFSTSTINKGQKDMLMLMYLLLFPPLETKHSGHSSSYCTVLTFASPLSSKTYRRRTVEV